jgi:hypothetical protein
MAGAVSWANPGPLEHPRRRRDRCCPRPPGPGDASSQTAISSAAARLVRYQQFVSASGRLAIVILREPSSPDSLLCDGEPLIAASPSPCSARVAPVEARDVSPGDRFSDQQSGLTVICPRGGAGQLTFGGRPLLRVRAPASAGKFAEPDQAIPGPAEKTERLCSRVASGSGV